MNNIYIKIISLFMIIINLAAGINEYSSGEMYNLLNSKLNTSICEYKVQGSYYLDDISCKNVNSQLDMIIRNLKRYIGQVSLEKSGKDDYNILFSDRNYSGSIDISQYKGRDKITVALDISGEDIVPERIKGIRDGFTKAISTISSNVEYSLSVKSKILSNTMDEVKEKVEKELYKCNSKDVESVKINNGYSIVADTGISREVKVLNKNIDFQCAIVKYSSGCYLIVGTPEILITY